MCTTGSFSRYSAHLDAARPLHSPFLRDSRHRIRARFISAAEDVTHVPAFKRDVNTVFQNYELFPHLTVSENVAYGPRMKKTNKHEATTRVEEMLQIVQLGELSERYPRELSGGEQQRVALARALVNRPAALLLDEPLSALDVKLRKQMQHELKQLQMALGTTFIYVTHDQEEAMVMSDRIAVMNHGKILQTGTPLDIYEAPTTGFVADFIGSLNVITVTATRANDGRVIAAMSEGMVELEPATPIGEEVMVAIRPERISLASPSTDPEPEVSYLPGEVSLVDFRGTTWYVELMTDAGTISALVVNDGGSRGWAPGDRMLACWQRDAVFTLPVVD